MTSLIPNKNILLNLLSLMKQICLETRGVVGEGGGGGDEEDELLVNKNIL